MLMVFVAKLPTDDDGKWPLLRAIPLATSLARFRTATREDDDDES